MSDIIPIDNIQSKIYNIRNQKVMLDSDLAELYGVETKYLNRQVKRNISRFPVDFMFQLTKIEYSDFLRSQKVTLKRGEHSKYLPKVFSDNGIAMLSSILNSERAIAVNIQIMRIFTILRKSAFNHEELQKRIDKIEAKYDNQFISVFNAIKRILDIKPIKPKRPMGFDTNSKSGKPD